MTDHVWGTRPLPVPERPENRDLGRASSRLPPIPVWQALDSCVPRMSYWNPRGFRLRYSSDVMSRFSPLHCCDVFDKYVSDLDHYRLQVIVSGQQDIFSHVPTVGITGFATIGPRIPRKFSRRTLTNLPTSAHSKRSIVCVHVRPPPRSQLPAAGQHPTLDDQRPSPSRHPPPHAPSPPQSRAPLRPPP